MNIYTQPVVRLIAKPEMVWERIQDFLDEQVPGVPEDQQWVQEDEVQPMDADSLPEFCGRMCYTSFGEKQGRKRNDAYIQNIVKMGHGSVLEHSNFSFLVTHCSRGFTHELVRHRAGFAFSQESTHYIDYTDPKTWSVCLDPRMPEEWREEAMSSARYAYQTYAKVYAALREKGVAKKEACSMSRQILPNGMESKIAFTANARAIRHFLEYRGNAANVLEIREVAVQVLNIMRGEAPAMFSDFGVRQGVDGIHEVFSTHRKV